MNTQILSYLSLRIFLFPLGLLPLPVLHFLGNCLGPLLFYCMKKFRKRTLSNLSLAYRASLSKAELIKLAKKSFQNLAINCLEYAKLSQIKKISSIVTCENPEEAKALIDQGIGVIFFCGHQANWELLFLEGTSRMPGVAIGRPIKNKYLYNWVLSIREKFGGTIIPPKDAVRKGFIALKKGKFLGIVGDQGMPESTYHFDFFGVRAWTTPVPAILSYKAKCPIVVATIKRTKNRYSIHYSSPIWPNLDAHMEEEIHRLMKMSLKLLEDSIRENPAQWLWQHNRWKQETPVHVYYRFRHDSILIILPNNKEKLSELLPHIKTMREIYPQAFLTLLIPEGIKPPFKECEAISYRKEEELFICDYRFKLVFNFTEVSKLATHFLKLGAFEVLDESGLKKAAEEHLKESDDLSMILKKALTRPNTIWSKDAS